jgi:hypothetical protein
MLVCPEVGNQLAHIGLLGDLSACLVRIKITVGAFAHTPGDVDIEGKRWEF